MQELLGRLTALDPAASQGLKVIAYFDALVDGHATPEMLLRGAAVLSGCPAGFRSDARAGRVAQDGVRTEAGDAATWPTRPISSGGVAWLERTGDPNANDEMILERLAIALDITLERSAPVAALRRAVETVLDPAEPESERQAAAARLKLDPHSSYRVDAVPAGSPPIDGHQSVMVTPAGTVRAIIRLATDAAPSGRAGIGVAGAPTGLADSWRYALAALRMTSDGEPVVRADELGAVLLLAEAAEASTGTPSDVAGVARLLAASDRALPALHALVTNDSLRSAATELGVHHSTLQARTAELSETLGYDVRSPAGRTRLALALRLHLFATSRFE
jgi:hypothetical protein